MGSTHYFQGFYCDYSENNSKIDFRTLSVSLHHKQAVNFVRGYDDIITSIFLCVHLIRSSNLLHFSQLVYGAEAVV